MKTNRGLLLSVLSACWLWAGPVQAQEFKLNQEKGIELDVKQPSQFVVQIEQGQRLRFKLKPVGGAALNSMIYVYVEGQRSPFDKSGWDKAHDWTMSKPPTGNQVKVRILAKQNGRASLEILDARSGAGEEGGKSPKTENKGTAEVRGKAVEEEPKRGDGRVDALERRLEQLERDVAEIKEAVHNLKK